MELIHHLFELQRSKLSQRNSIVENDAHSAEVAKECDFSNGLELRHSILKELKYLSLNQGEFDASNRGFSTDDDWGLGNEHEVGRASKNRYGYSSVGYGQWNKTDSNAQTEFEYDNGTEYPIRAGAEDCSFYMKFGSCKFGSSCKFNHPPNNNQELKERRRYRDGNSDKSGQTLCKFFSTLGWCRNGEECVFTHEALKLNSSGYPNRPGEKECSYYKLNGSCKYGVNCIFHHPELTVVTRTSSGSSNGVPRTSRTRITESESQTSSCSEWNEHKSDEDYPERPDQSKCTFSLQTGSTSLGRVVDTSNSEHSES